MCTLEEYKRQLEAILKPCGAFVRIDRGEALFVSDAPRRIAHTIELPSEFTFIVKNGLMYIKPVFSDVPESLRDFYLIYIKAGAVQQDRLRRMKLSECMRLKLPDEISFLNALGAVS